MSRSPASGSWYRRSLGLLVGVVMVCQVGCVGLEGSTSRIPSTSPAVIRTQAARYTPPVRAPGLESTQKLRGVTALAIVPDDVPAPMELERWIQGLVQRGITMVLLEMGTSPGSDRIGSEAGRPMAGVYFRSQWANTIRDIFGELVPLAHQHGLSVFAAVSPRRINWIDPTLGWLDRSYDAGHHQLRLSPYLDLFHPAFQEYLVGLLSDLADTGVDGILFRNDVSLGPYDAFSAFALRAFERDFQIRIDPAHLFTGTMAAGQTATSIGGASGQYPPEFWRWTGWKARERLKILERLARAMRLHGTTLQVAVEVHPEAITDPRAALFRYGEDLLEAKRRFQYFVLRSSASSSRTDVNEQPASALIERMKDLLGGPERIWMTIPLPSTESGGIGPSSQAQRMEFGKDIGLIYQSN